MVWQCFLNTRSTKERIDKWELIKIENFCFVKDPEGWDGEGGRREGQDGEHMYTHGWFMWMYGENHYNIIK